jgi:hypothetical protein
MRTILFPMALAMALSLPALANNNQGGNNNNQGGNNNNQGGNNNNQGGGYRGAPGPIVGAGLPVLLIGGGIYWMVRRKKRAS